MPAVNYNFIIEQGSELNLQFQYNDAANNAIDLSGDKCVILQVLPENQPRSSGIPFSSKAQAIYAKDNWELTADNKGLISFRLGSNYTSGILYNTAQYDLDVVSIANPNQNVRLAYGTITVQPRQTLYPKPIFTTEQQQDTTSSNTNTTTPEDNNNTPVITDDLCTATSCSNLDIYSIVYNGSGLALLDDATISGTVNVGDTRKVENVELVINNLTHTNPQDLQFLLAPPSGDKILLSANQKISNYTTNFSYMFSNKSSPTTFLHNVSNGGMCNIYDKTGIIKYSSETLVPTFDHLFNHSGLTGNWNLIVKDTDPLGSGSIGGWKLIVTYIPE